MILFPNAKINLGLNILNKREDGFHNIETLFFPITSLQDSLELIVNKIDHHRFSSSGIYIDSTSDNNLVMKAVRAMEAKFTIPYLDIHLHKHIPLGAGLGGGSADATFTLIAINSMFKLGLSDSELESIASTIGSDCPLFVKNRPMLGTGRGEILTPFEISLSGKKIVLIKPDEFVGTAEAYSGVEPSTPNKKIEDLLKRPIEEWQESIVNDFEHSIFKNHPVISDIKDKLINIGALYSSMSGSGSTVFAIFNSDINFDFRSKFEGNFVWEAEL